MTAFVNGYDLDGAICNDPTDWLVTKFDLPIVGILAVRWHHASARLLAKPDPNSVIITGRLEVDYLSTVKWLHRHGINIPIFMNPWTPAQGTDWKACVIENLGLKRYTESDASVANELANRLPNVEVLTPDWIVR